MKLLVFFIGLAMLTGGFFLAKPIARKLPEFGLLDFLISGLALSLLTSGAKMVWASFFLP
jgi:hypothetical protein